jgi:membrane protein YqaA with SNARE-associated domain
MEAWTQHLLELLALPEYGLSTVFWCHYFTTLFPLGSEPFVFCAWSINPLAVWQAVLVATAGNTLGGAVDWWIALPAGHTRSQMGDGQND